MDIKILWLVMKYQPRNLNSSQVLDNFFYCIEFTKVYLFRYRLFFANFKVTPFLDSSSYGYLFCALPS